MRYTHTNAYRYGNIYAYSDAHSNSNADAHTYIYTKTYSHAAACTITEVSPYPATAPVTHDAISRVYDAPGNVIETHEHAGDFVEP